MSGHHHHGHGEGHGKGHGAACDHGGGGRSLKAAFCITAVFAAVEIAGGLLTGSISLLSDALHMVSDVTAL